jgi:DNA-binding SARP family transcriptional activator
VSELKITMFGEFSISYNGIVLTEKSRRSRNIWSLLQYLITFHDREISQFELIDLLWGESESDNPVGALKTQMHRLRSVLKELGCEQEIVVNTLGSYAFNNNIPHTIDTEVFEDLYKRSRNPNLSYKEILSYLKQAIALYRGDFLPKSSLESWVVPINTYYRSLYVKIVHETVDLLYQEGNLKEITEICRKAIIIDPYDEKLHYHLIFALSELGDQKSAKEHYHYVTDLFYTKFGVTPSEDLVNLYKKTVINQNNIETDLSTVTGNLTDASEYNGAFFCEYEFFKHLYQMEVRDAQRKDKKVLIALISISDENGNLPEQKKLNRTMTKLRECICRSLRVNDIFSRYSVSQYVLMLSDTDYENGERIMKRILEQYKKENPKSKTVISYQYQSLRNHTTD